MWYFYHIWNGSSLTAIIQNNTADLGNDENMDCGAQYVKGEAMKKVITKAL